MRFSSLPPFSACSVTLAICTGFVIVADASGRTLELNNGDTISGELIKSDNQSVTLSTAALGEITISRDDIANDNVDPLPPATASDRYIENVAESVDSVLFPGWKKSFSAGLSGSNGNSDTLSIYADFSTGYEDPTDRWTVDSSYFFSKSGGQTEQNELNARVLKDWLLPDERHFYWAALTYQFDQQTSFDSRIGAFGGVGYQLLEGPVHVLDARVGLGGNYEFGDVNEFTPEGFIGLDYEWKIDGNQGVTAFNYFYPSLDPAFSHYRNNTGLAYKAKLRAADGLSFKAGIRNEFRSEVREGEDNNDLKYFVALGFDF